MSTSDKDKLHMEGCIVIIGLLSASIGAGVLWGFGYGLLTFGGTILVVGFINAQLSKVLRR